MARNVANVDIAVETFGAWVTRTNTMLDALSTEIITANATFANTGTPAAQRNAQLYGSFVANTFVVATALTGGSNTSTFANLAITSNAVFTGAAVNVASNATFTSNVTFTGANVFINGTNATVNANTNINGNTTFSNVVTMNSNVNLNSTTTFITDYVIDVAANSNIGTTAASRLVYTFPKATYRTGKLMIQASRSGNNQIAEMVVAHDGTDAFLTVYGTVASPSNGNTAAPLGTFTAAINNANVEIKMNQTANSTAVKVIAHLIK